MDFNFDTPLPTYAADEPAYAPPIVDTTYCTQEPDKTCTPQKTFVTFDNASFVMVDPECDEVLLDAVFSVSRVEGEVYKTYKVIKRLSFSKASLYAQAAAIPAALVEQINTKEQALAKAAANRARVLAGIGE